jgi:diphthine-ammonia ligase
MACRYQVVALISGGKDSCFNMMQCMAQGHDVVALANLHPPLVSDDAAAADELDSHMFQTVGWQMARAISRASGLPLVTQPLLGTNQSKALHYEVQQADEVEDLFQLLARVKMHFAHVNAVSCGAILSHYQRNRVEHVYVCQRPSPWWWWWWWC